MYFLRVLLVFSTLFLALARGADSNVPLTGQIVRTNGVPRFILSWQASQGATYKVRATDNLNSAWTTVEPVHADVAGPIRWMAPEALGQKRFFELELPQTQISAVEPAVFAPGMLVELYVLGQCFANGDQIRIDNTVVGGTLFIDSTTLRAILMPLTEGPLRVSVVRAGQLLSFFDVLCASASNAPNAVLQELADWPPASPGRVRSGGVIRGGVVIANGKTGRDCDDGPGGIRDLGGGSHGGDCDDARLNNWPGQFVLQPFSGEIQHQVTDMWVAGLGQDFVWVRTYRSRTGRRTTMGQNWDHCYNLYLEQVGQGLVFYDGTGRRELLFPQPDGTFSRNGLFYQANVELNGRIKVKFPWLAEMEFHALDGSNTAGKILSSTDRNGHAMTFEYDASGRLSTINDTLGRPFHIVYNDDGFVEKVIDHTLRVVGYQYDGAPGAGGGGNLVSVTTPEVIGTPSDFPDGKTTHYSYATGFVDERLNHNLLSVTDPKDQTWLRIVYRPNEDPAAPNFDTVDYVQRGPYRIKLRRGPQEPTLDNQFVATKCIINDGVGNVSELYFDSLNRLVRELDFTGRANPDLATTEANNRPTGKLRAQDPEFFETRYAWNADSMPTRVIHPRGNQTFLTYESDFDAAARPFRKAELRSIRGRACCGGADTDGDGGLDLTERTWRFEYDPRFGSPDLSLRKGWDGTIKGSPRADEFARGPRQSVSVDGSFAHADPDYRKGWDGTIKGSAGYNEVGRGPRQSVSVDGSFSQVDDAQRKGWDGTIKGSPRVDEFARGPRQSVSLDGTYATGAPDERKGWDGTIKGKRKSIMAARGPRQSVSVDGSFSHGSLAHRKGWDGTIKGSPRADEFARGPRQSVSVDGSFSSNDKSERKGWDGTIKGNPTAARGPRQSVSLDGTYASNEPDRRKGWDGTIKGNPWMDPDTDGESFVSRVVDPRGEETRCAYDAHGNPVHVEITERKSGQVIVGDFDYDAVGRLVAMTHPADGGGCRRVDTFEYYDDDPTAVGYGYLRVAWRDNGILVCATTHLRLATTFEYDAVGNVTRVIDPRGHDTLYTYNALDQLVRWIGPCCPCNPCGPGVTGRSSQEFLFDGNDNLIQIDCENRNELAELDPDNPVWSTVAQFDLLNRCELLGHELAHIVQQGGGVQTRFATQQFVYDPNDHVVTALSPEAVAGNDPHNIVQFEYDERNLPFRVTRAPNDPQAAVDRFDYDGNGNLARLTVGGPNLPAVTTLTSDGFDRCTTITDPLGNVITFSFDASDNCVRRRLEGELQDGPGERFNRSLAETRFEYDSLSRLTHRRAWFFELLAGVTIGDGEATTVFAYAPNSLLMSVTDDNGHTTQYSYDNLYRLDGVTLADGSAISYEYDETDNIIRVGQNDQQTIAATRQEFFSVHVYDGLNRLTTSQDNSGNTFHYRYDSRDNLVSFVDPRDNEVTFTYDGLNRVTSASAHQGRDRGITISTSHVEYDTQRKVSQTDHNGHTTQFSYDALDRCVAIRRADGTQRLFAFDPRDNLVAVQDANGTVVTLAYDWLDRCERKVISTGAGVENTTTLEVFKYDGMSRLVYASNDSSTCQFAYDSLGNQVRSEQDGRAHLSYYDGVGNRLTMVYPGGREANYTYEVLDRLTTVSSSPSPEGVVREVINIGYEGPHRVGRLARANGINTRINWNGVAGTANAAGDHGWQQVSRVNHARAMGGAVIDQRGCTYDASQNKLSRTQVVPFVAGNPTLSDLFVYDVLQRLVQATHRRGVTIEADNVYTLDGVGNRLHVSHLGGSDDYTLDATFPDPADYQVNQYTSTPLGPLRYDANGNLLSIDRPAGSTIFHYDYANRLVFVERSVGPALVPIARFTYDALGRRIAKTIYPPAPAAEQTTEFIYDECRIIEARQGDALLASFVLPEVGDEVIVAFIATGEAAYYHYDDVGNVLALTDEDGAVLERYDYDEFGSPRFLAPNGSIILDNGAPITASPLGNPFLFHGMFWDSESGLYWSGSGRHTKEVGPIKWMAPEALSYGHSVQPIINRYCDKPENAERVAASLPGENPNNPWSPNIQAVGLRLSNSAQVPKVTVRGWDPK